MRALTRRYLMASDGRRHGGCSPRSGPARPCAVRRLPLHAQPWRRALGECRRRTKTQASFSAEDAALPVFYGIVAFGQIQLRKIDGYYQLPALLEKEWEKVA